MSKSVAPELRDYLRTKFAEPNALDIYNQYSPDALGVNPAQPSLAGMSRAEIEAAGTGQPRTIGEKYNPFTPEGRDRILDWGANTDAAKAVSEFGNNYGEFAQNNANAAAKAVADTTKPVREFGSDWWRNFKEYGYNNPIWRGSRAAWRGLNAMTDPKNKGNEFSAGANALVAGDNPAPAGAGSAAPTASIPGPTTGGEQTAIFPLDNTTAYGLGGAGAGALLGAAMSRKGKRGRNALLGAGLGGGAGLLAQYLMSQPGQPQKTAAKEKQAENPTNNVPFGLGPGFAVDMAEAAGAARGQTLGAAGGVGLGGLAGALYGAYDPGAKAVLDENGNPILKRRNRILSSLRGGLVGATLGGTAGNLVGNSVGGAVGRNEALKELQKKSATKSATDMLHDALGTGAGGAVIGSLYGALTARKKKLLRSVLRGALIGGGTGTAMGAGMAAFGNPVGATTDNPSAAEHAGFNRGFGSAAAGGLGAALSQRLADEYLPLEDEEEKTGGLDPALIAPLTGAAVGGGIGALTDKKKRLRNALIGAAAGGGLGGAAEFALPGIGLGGKYRVQDLFRGHPAKPTNWANTLGRVPEIGEYAGRRESNLPGLQLLYGVSAGEATRTPLDDLGDAAAPYTKRVGEGVKKLDETVTPWLDWFNGKKPQQP